jgi:outer membrane protein assembly factor BamB
MSPPWIPNLNRVEWQRRIPLAANSSCGAEFVTLVTRPTTAEFPAAGMARGGFGRGGPAKSAVARAGGPPGFPVRGRGPAIRRPAELHTLTADGMLYTMYVSSGEEPHPPMKFLPPGAAARGLIVVDETVYAVTADACGVGSGVWALNMETGQVANWNSEAPISGEAGAAMGPDGTLYVATGAGKSDPAMSILALESKTLKVKDSYAANTAFASGARRDAVRKKAASRRSRGMGASIWWMRRRPVGPIIIRRSLSSRAFRPREMSRSRPGRTSRERAGLPLPVRETSRRGKSPVENGAPAVETRRTSPEIASPGPVSVIHNVAFVVSRQGPAVVHGLDVASGKELWNSGKAISARAQALVAGGGGQIYVTGRDGALYAFGFPWSTEREPFSISQHLRLSRVWAFIAAGSRWLVGDDQ